MLRRWLSPNRCPQLHVTCLTFLASLAAPVTTPGQTVLYVDANNPGTNDGSSWRDAYGHLQDALDHARGPGSEVTEIRVAHGTYKPDLGATQVPGDRQANFELVDGVLIRGAYQGYGSAEPDLRNVRTFETILSGDLLGNDAADKKNYEDNSLHIIRADNLGTETVLEGVTVTGGNSDGLSYPDYFGAGILLTNSLANLRNCIFRENLWSAVYITGHSRTPTFSDCSIIDNSGGSAVGLGTCATRAVFRRCMFQHNTSPSVGAALRTSCGSATLINCVFSGNHSESSGGAVYGDAEMFNCLLVGNTAGGNGGAVSFVPAFGAERAKMVNCTIAGNSALNRTGGVYYLNVDCSFCSPVIQNCIFWGNTDLAGISEENAQLDISPRMPPETDFQYNHVQGWRGFFGGLGNTGNDPKFVSLPGSDGLPGTLDDNLRLAPGSPCIDAGDSDVIPVDLVLDVAGQPRFIDDPGTPDTGAGSSPVVDIGAYEFGGPCGNVMLDPGETCDDGPSNSDAVPNACRTNCMLPICGDNVTDNAEECDGTSDEACPNDCLQDCTCDIPGIPTLSHWSLLALAVMLLALSKRHYGRLAT